MKKVKIITGICWAFAGLIVILVLFPSLNGLSTTVSKLPFMKINPRYTGGEIASVVTEKNCTIDVRRPVFNGLVSERQTGFVQVDWKGQVPEIINDTIDYNNDGKKDMIITINRKQHKTDLYPIDHHVKSVAMSTPTSYGWSVRINLEK